jgi:DNA invertase Pin-like site-specific DNA recombinase
MRHQGKFISYLRVSTRKQGADGLGIAAQRQAIETYLNGGKWQIVAEYVEVETGKRADRPKLAEALAACKLHRATLIIAKIDRLARNAAFLLGLRDSGIDFIACDMPDANRLTVGILAVVAEDEAQRISDRTKAALARSKKKLGGYRGVPPTAKARAAAYGANRAKTAARAALLKPEIEKARAAGAKTWRAIAAELNERGIPTATGAGEWSGVQVGRVLAVIDA